MQAKSVTGLADKKIKGKEDMAKVREILEYGPLDMDGILSVSGLPKNLLLQIINTMIKQKLIKEEFCMLKAGNQKDIYFIVD